ncbi:MAG: Mrp/NBP35 family ATP-binding protein [Vicingaceae bacterium]
MEEKKVLEALSNVMDPDLKKDIVELGLVSNISIDGKRLSFDLKLKNPAMHYKKRMEEAIDHHINRYFGEVEVDINVVSESKPNPPAAKKVLSGVKNIIAVASGKGGVGKSTVSANIAVGLALRGYSVGIVDADIYGPSIPLMFDTKFEKPEVVQKDGKNLMKPIENHGVKMLSIGFFAQPDQAVAWRGPMASKALNQMFSDTDWGELDFMIIDLPPGTGDIHLSLVQAVPVTGAVIVSTPQEVALIDARKAVGMFRIEQINVPVLGLIENMAYFTPAELPDNKYYIFGRDGVAPLAESLKIPFLGQVPLVQSIREAGDIGRPAVLQENTVQKKAFDSVIDELIKELVDRNQLQAPTQKVEITNHDGCL